MMVPAVVSAHSTCHGHRILRGTPAGPLQYTQCPCSREARSSHDGSCDFIAPRNLGNRQDLTGRAMLGEERVRHKKSPEPGTSPHSGLAAHTSSVSRHFHAHFVQWSVEIHCWIHFSSFYHISPLGIRYKAFLCWWKEQVSQSRRVPDFDFSHYLQVR